MASVENANKALHDAWLETAITYKADWEDELFRRAHFGVTGLPDPLPHPDHVIIDIRKGTARIAGPSTKEEKAKWDRQIACKADFEAEVEELQRMLAEETDPRMRQILFDDIAHSQKIVDKAANWRGLVKPSSLRVPLNETIMRRLTGVASDKGFQLTRTTIQVIVADALSQAINASNAGLFSWARGQTK